jgi:multiple sugar transport system ATP-binding protein
LIAGLEEISGGELLIGERIVNDLEPKERGIAMVFQSYAIFPHMTVRENIAFGLTIRKEKPPTIESRVENAARLLQMEELPDRRPSQLSGGQRQRVAIGRAIVRDPSVFLFDEPLSNLDAALRMSTRQEIASLHEKLGTTMIYVTHDQVQAMTLADKIVVLRDGEVMQCGAPMELFHKPANLFVAGFLGAPSMNFLPVTVNNVTQSQVVLQGADSGLLQLSTNGLPFTTGQAATLGIRPQHLRLVQHESAVLRGQVVLTESLGSETVVDVQMESGRKLIATLPEDAELAAGGEVSFDFDPRQAHVFAETP